MADRVILKLVSFKKEDHIFFQKIIEIISNIKYNFNLKLQLTSASLQIEEENRR